MKFFLRLKAWQLFSAFMFLFLETAIFNMDIDAKVNPVILYGGMMLWVVFIIAWVYAIGTTMHKLAPFELKPIVGYFKFNCWFLPVVFLSFSIGLNFLYHAFPAWAYVLFILIFFALYFFLFISIWLFAGRMLESMIQGSLVRKSESLKMLILFWFFPIGVWTIQPALRRIIKANSPSLFGNE